MCVKDTVEIKKSEKSTICALGEGTKVLLFNGETKKIEDVDVDDVLLGAGGEPVQIDFLVKGRGDLYKVSPNRGEPFVIGANHPMSLVVSGSMEGDDRPEPKKHIYSLPNGDTCTYGDEIVLDAEEFKQCPPTTQRDLKLYRSGAEFEKTVVDIPPYILGIWLGDGTSSAPEITTMDQEVVDALREYGEENGLVLRKIACRKENAKAFTYRLSAPMGFRLKGCNPFTNALRHYELIKNKHIPKEYLINDRETRLELLAGIVDSDGYCHDDSRTIDIVTVSDTLAEQILFLARSLGLAAVRKDKIVNGKVYNRIYLNGDTEIIPTRIQRRFCCEKRGNRSAAKTGVKVEPSGAGKYYGFKLLGDDQRFLLSDFTVTGAFNN